eukprot:TRINITY_DN5584_c0_g1_i1.p1 TRINITY_DN5584_c0_g1~~TRINITY_DN5584_c0_g1_i1.p1  ORF type:complete len:230 (+),score=60.42 TRINITY_DN5584_c0_g1_i1:23-712(+)
MANSDEETFYVLLELGDWSEVRQLVANSEYTIRNLNTESPLLQLDDKFFRGRYEETFTQLMFEEKVQTDEDGNRSVIGLVNEPIIAKKKIAFDRILLRPKAPPSVPLVSSKLDFRPNIEKTIRDITEKKVVKRKRPVKKKQDKAEEEPAQPVETEDPSLPLVVETSNDAPKPFPIFTKGSTSSSDASNPSTPKKSKTTKSPRKTPTKKKTGDETPKKRGRPRKNPPPST